ncbi:hypothetical protein [Modestobacter roseus]|uniref:hypothetical protein n=1 Tax=Modestobacter roseus TaxID=1181884 RepID=UPI0012974AC1|nr:hypothetical protein [Modestobacter roseus]MQA35362.1 hypothetical protein [Modestobacter roseus]
MSDEREARGGATALAAVQENAEPTEAPAAEPATAGGPQATGPVPTVDAPPVPAPARADQSAPPESESSPAGAGDGTPAGPPHPTPPHPTTPVDVRRRPRPRLRRPDPMIRMGPWAPVAGAGVGLLLGLVVVLFLAPAVDTFDQRLSLVFVVLGLSLLGAGGTLLADEVRLLRRGAQAAEARAANVGVIAGLLNGLTPARLLITASAFVLLLSAYVTGGS